MLEQLGELRRQMRTLLREVEQLRADVSDLRSERQGRFSGEFERGSRGERFEPRGRVGGRFGAEEEDGFDQPRRSSQPRDEDRRQDDRGDF
ncbi:MAG: hypothetical protein WD278_04055 [Pirellulales bacterium]